MSDVEVVGAVLFCIWFAALVYSYFRRPERPARRGFGAIMAAIDTPEEMRRAQARVLIEDAAELARSGPYRITVSLEGLGSYEIASGLPAASRATLVMVKAVCILIQSNRIDPSVVRAIAEISIEAAKEHAP